MNRLFPTSQEPRPVLPPLGLAAIVVAGAAARVLVMWRFEPASGDGPLRALLADWWVRGLWQLDTACVDHNLLGWWCMRLPMTGPWPPAHFVLIGLPELAFQDPLFSARLLSLLMGIASIILIYHVGKKTFDTAVGLLSAAMLAFLPLHVTLSTNPLAEVPAVFIMLLMFSTVLMAMDSGFSTGSVVLLSVLTFVGTLIRYELWLMLPIIALAYLCHRRSVWRTALVSIAISLAPIGWMVSAWWHHGGPLASFETATLGSEPIGALETMRRLVRELSIVAGYFVVMASVLGAALAVAESRWNRISVSRALYLGLVLLQLAFYVWFTSERGASLWNRYSLISVVLMMPLAAYALSLDRSLVQRCVAGVVLVGSMLFSVFVQHGTLYIRFEVPASVSETAGWLSREMEPGETFISTRLVGDAATIGLLTGSTPHNVAYPLHTTDQLQAIWDAVRPSYVVILAGEEPGERLLRQFESEIDRSEPPQMFGQISVYRVRRDAGT